MSTLSKSIPVVAGAVGPAVNVKNFSFKKTFVVSGINGTVNIEAGINGEFCTLATVQGSGTTFISDLVKEIVCEELRIDATKSSSGVVMVAAEEAESQFITIPGGGASVDVTEFGDWVTAISAGTVKLQISQDDINFSQVLKDFTQGPVGSCHSGCFSARYARVDGNSPIQYAAQDSSGIVVTPQDGIVYSQDNPNAGDNIYATWQGAYEALLAIKDPGPKNLYYDSRFAPVSARVLGNPQACQIPAGPTANGALTFVADNGSGNSEITGADFLALGFNPEGGECVFIKDAPTNGWNTAFYTTVSASSTALVLAGTVLSNEGPVAARVILAWDMRSIKNLSLLDITDNRQTTNVIALDGAMALGLEEISNRSGTQPFQWFNDSSEPFAVFPDFSGSTISLGVNGIGSVHVYSYDDTSAPFYEYGLDTVGALVFGSSASGVGAFQGKTSPAPIFKHPPLFTSFGFFAPFFLAGGVMTGNVIEGSALYFVDLQQSPQESQYSQENSSFINLLEFFGDPQFTIYVPTGGPRLTVAQGHIATGNFTFVPGSGGSPQIQGAPGAFASFFGNESIRVSGTASNDGLYRSLFTDGDTLFLASVGPPLYGTDLTAEGPVASQVQVSLRQEQLTTELVDGETYFLETAWSRVGETIVLKSANIPTVAAVTISGLPAGQSPSFGQETIDGAATQDIAIGESSMTVYSDGTQWLISSKI